MKETIQKHSKLIGLFLGLLQGIPQGIELPNQPLFPAFSQNTIWLVIGFGLFAPPLLAFINSFVSSGFGLEQMRKNQ